MVSSMDTENLSETVYALLLKKFSNLDSHLHWIAQMNYYIWLLYVPWKKRTWTKKDLRNYFPCNLNSLSLTWWSEPTSITIRAWVVLLFVGLLLWYQVAAIWSPTYPLRLVFVGVSLGSVLHVAIWSFHIAPITRPMGCTL